VAGFEDDEEQLLRSVALQNANSILFARQRAEEELLRTKEALRESQERLTAALTAAGTGTFRWNLQTNIVEWDGNLDRLFGLESDRTAQSLEAFLAAVHPDDRLGVLTRCERCARDGSDFDMEFRVIWPDGSVHWIDDKAKASFDADGKPLYMTGACADITSRKEAEEALLENEARLRAIFNQAAVGITVADLDGRFLDMNRKFMDILGYSADELRRLTFAAITHPDDLRETTSAIEHLLGGATAEYSLEKRYLRKDGSAVWSLSTVTLLKDAAGEPQRFIGVIEDITARKEAEEALRNETRENARLYEAAQQAAEERTLLLESERAARSEAERMSEVKDEFLATLSHELRTPLNAILGWAQVLRGVPRDQVDYVKGLETIERNARVQTQLIDDLLDMSRITSGKLRMDIQPVQPVSFIEAAVETVKHSADAKGIRLERILDPAAGPISGDPGRLQQVIWNLLSNAIKFTPKDGKVQIVLERVNSHIEISVADTGTGIKAEFIPYLFERFRQGDASTTRKHGGLGLGLSIVKRLVELHGGTVQVESPGEGLGTTVTVHLPLTVVHRSADSGERLHPKVATASVTSVNCAELTGLKVLVVDDQSDARDLIKRVLEDCAANVFTAASVADALVLVQAQKPDVLISDIGMPDADGFDLLRRVRALGAERGGKVPAIALTAFARSEDRTRALRAGFVVHVSKPVDPSELIATVASVAGRVDDPS
jgi:PAS domain S-box-containing protein